MSIIKLDQDTAIKKLSEKCSDSLLQATKGVCLYFAEEKTDLEFGLVRPEPMSYTEDERYQLLHILMENTPGWTKFPKRDRSVITSTSSVPMNRSHTVYIVLPINGTKLGICSEDDFYTSFDNVEKEFNVKDGYEFEQSFKQLLNCVNQFVHEKDLEDWTNKDVQQVCAMFDNIMKSLKGSFNFRTFYETTTDKKLDAWTKRGSLYQTIIHAMDPELNGFEIKSIKEMKKKKNREVWFSNECYVISKNLFDEIIDSGKLAHIFTDNT